MVKKEKAEAEALAQKEKAEAQERKRIEKVKKEAEKEAEKEARKERSTKVKETTEEKEKREQAKAKKKASEVKVSARRQRDMKISDIEKVLLEQQDELEALEGEVLIHRPEEDLINLNSKLAQVVIGVRRSGKSTLCFNALRKAGVHYAYANFDDERLEELETQDLDNVLQTLYKIYGKFDYLFLDEIQNIDGWPLFVNRLLRQRIHIIITGSNAKLLSTELATHLTGRHHKIELFPFSFKDWCSIKEVDYTRLTTKNKGLLSKAYEEYFRQGGFPELINLNGDETKRNYVSALKDTILLKDIIQRHQIKDVKLLEDIFVYLVNKHSAEITSVKKLVFNLHINDIYFR